jgi:ubiquinone/menaquinone biosynthesis C-methylase UbiE
VSSTRPSNGWVYTSLSPQPIGQNNRARLGAYAAGRAEAWNAEFVARFQSQEREQHLLRLLDRCGMLPLAGKKILDVGCGTGKWLRDLIALGADPESVYGVELLPASAARARRLLPPAVTIECANAATLTFPSASFDIVLQASVFTSVLDDEIRCAMAAEMLRVVRPNGIILWYDLLPKRPSSSYVRPVTKDELHRLFPGCSFDLRRITLALPIIRMVAPRSWPACLALSRIPALCTHYLGAIRRAPTRS